MLAPGHSLLVTNPLSDFQTSQKNPMNHMSRRLELSEQKIDQKTIIEILCSLVIYWCNAVYKAFDLTQHITTPPPLKP